MYKKGYFFIIDAIIALFVLMIGITLVVSSYSFQQPTRQLELLDSDILVTLQTQIKNNGNLYCGIGGELMQPWDMNITDAENTYLQQFGEFYYRNETGDCDFCNELIETCAQQLFPDIFPYSLNLTINDESVFYIDNSDLSSATLIIPRKDIVFGTYNQQAYGPYLVEVTMWN